MFEIIIKGNTPEELYDFMQELLHKRNPVVYPGKGVPAQPAAQTAPPLNEQAKAMLDAAHQQPTQPAMGNPMPPVNIPAAQPTHTAAPASAAPTNPAPLPHTASATPPPMTSPSNGVPQAAAPTYTLDQLARAGAALAQSGKMEDALALLARYGVQTVNQLKPEQYGAFATELRALGAQV